MQIVDSLYACEGFYEVETVPIEGGFKTTVTINRDGKNNKTVEFTWDSFEQADSGHSKLFSIIWAIS